ncbi:hypothetical protein C8F01DRAFT_1377736 [Mycena amicta]|nr:hypothetical protein C8F01DRAFT_1377736 [Mycena amicta]
MIQACLLQRYTHQTNADDSITRQWHPSHLVQRPYLLATPVFGPSMSLVSLTKTKSGSPPQRPTVETDADRRRLDSLESTHSPASFPLAASELPVHSSAIDQSTVYSILNAFPEVGRQPFLIFVLLPSLSATNVTVARSPPRHMYRRRTTHAPSYPQPARALRLWPLSNSMSTRYHAPLRALPRPGASAGLVPERALVLSPFGTHPPSVLALSPSPSDNFATTARP